MNNARLNVTDQVSNALNHDVALATKHKIRERNDEKDMAKAKKDALDHIKLLQQEQQITREGDVTGGYGASRNIMTQLMGLGNHGGHHRRGGRNHNHGDLMDPRIARMLHDM